MSVNQGSRQAAFRATAGTTGSYNGDFLASAATQGFTGEFNGVFIQWLQDRTGSSDTNLDNLKQTFAELVGAHNWESVGFVPSLLTGTQLWLDASDSDTITEVGGAVSQWDDKSGKGNDATQGTGANQPTVNTAAQNGRDTITWDGINDVLQITAAASINNIYASGGTTFTVHIPTSTGGGGFGRIVDKDAGSGNTLFLHAESGGMCEPRFIQSFDTTEGDWSTTVKSITIGSANLTTLVYDASSTSNNPTFKTNGSADTTAETSAPVGSSDDDSANALNIGNRGALDRGYDGDIAEVISYDRTLTATEITNVENYLTAKWGI